MRTAIDDWHSLANIKRKIDTPVSVSAERIIELDDEIQQLREALQDIINQNPDPKLPYGRIVVEIAHEALSHSPPPRARRSRKHERHDPQAV